MKCYTSITLTSALVGLALLLGSLPAAAQLEDYTYKLTQSTGSYELWTTTPSQRVLKNGDVPVDTSSQVLVYAAKNEFEPFVVVVKPTSSGAVTVDMGNFGSGIEVEIYQEKYVNITTASDSQGATGDYPDPLWPIEDGSTIGVTAGENTAFWFSVYVQQTVDSGDYVANVQIGGIDIPITLHVFNFAVPAEIHVKSQMNVNHQTFLAKYGVSGTSSDYWMYVDKIKRFFIDHRLTPKGTLWSGGLTSSGGAPFIDYDCAGTLTDNNGIWGFEDPAERYLTGAGLMEGQFSQSFNGGTGFPSFMAATFKNADSSADQRPTTFCSQSLASGDWYTGNNPSSPYNQEWFEYLTALETYLNSQGYLDKAYYYFANEPQDQDDYDAIAWYSQELKKVAPNLKLMVSEEPKSEIYNHATYTGSKVDIWLPVLQQYDPAISHVRKADHGEASWIYFLNSTRPPYFNPITLDHPGVESKLTGWFLWKYRVEGIAYYSLNNWSQNPWTDPANNGHNGDLFMLYPPSESNSDIAYGSNNHRFVPSIRLELMRDSLEDYEYLRALNGNADPVVNVENSSDTQAGKIVSGLVGYTRDSEFMYNLRRVIGLKIGGEIAEIPDIYPAAAHPRAEGDPGNYYVNFQDPDGEPTTTFSEDTFGNGYTYKYVTYAGHDYLQAGIEEYDQTAGYGWYDDNEHFLFMRDALGDEQDERKITYVFDDWAQHPNVFEFDLPPGTYDVEICVGTPRWSYDHNRVVIEGVAFIDDEPNNYYIVRSDRVTVNDAKLTVDVGIGQEYTMLNYLNIEAAAPDLDTDTDTDTDTGANCSDADPDTTFIKTITGQVLFGDGSPMEGKIQLCVPNCINADTDSNGDFTLPFNSCKLYGFAAGTDAPLHVTLVAPGGTHAVYSSAYAPTQDEVSDLGEDDLDFNLGTLTLYELPTSGVSYDATNGASVDMDGMSFELSPEALIAHAWDSETSEFSDNPVEEATIKVLKTPANWDAPFDEMGMDALYFIGPYWAKLAGSGTALTIEPPDGWSDGDTGTIYILGEALMGLGESMEYIAEASECPEPQPTCLECVNESDPLAEHVEIGKMAGCGSAVFEGGKIVTSPIPRFGWIGIKK